MTWADVFEWKKRGAVILSRRASRYGGAWSRRWLAIRRWFVGSLEPVVSFDMYIVRHEEEVEYLRRLQTSEPQANELMSLDRDMA